MQGDMGIGRGDPTTRYAEENRNPGFGVGK
jgi:hypothetical protein